MFEDADGWTADDRGSQYARLCAWNAFAQVAPEEIAAIRRGEIQLLA